MDLEAAEYGLDQDPILVEDDEYDNLDDETFGSAFDSVEEWTPAQDIHVNLEREREMMKKQLAPPSFFDDPTPQRHYSQAIEMNPGPRSENFGVPTFLLDESQTEGGSSIWNTEKPNLNKPPAEPFTSPVGSPSHGFVGVERKNYPDASPSPQADATFHKFFGAQNANQEFQQKRPIIDSAISASSLESGIRQHPPPHHQPPPMMPFHPPPPQPFTAPQQTSYSSDSELQLTLTQILQLQQADINRQHRQVWQKRSKYMSAFEIDSIMSIQQLQLKSSSPYVDDFYHQNALRGEMKNCLKSGQNLYTLPELPVTNHVPLYDNASIPAFSRKSIEMIGVLGKLPNHTVRAPRMILDLPAKGAKAREGTEEDSSLRRLIAQKKAIENAFDLLINLEDVDDLLFFTPPNNTETINHFNAQRLSLTRKLLDRIGVYIPMGDRPPPVRREDAICAWKEDETLAVLLSSQKGRKLCTRFLSKIDANSSYPFLAFSMRNMALIIALYKQDPDTTFDELFRTLFSIATLQQLPSLVSLVAILLDFHVPDLIVHIVRHEQGAVLLILILALIEKFLFQSPPHLVHPYRQSWEMVFMKLTQYLTGRYDMLFQDNPSDEHFSRICQFLLIIARRSGPQHRFTLLSEIKERMAAVTETHPSSAIHVHQLVSTLVEGAK